jgi:rhodanese-related sulfurtransferase
MRTYLYIFSILFFSAIFIFGSCSSSKGSDNGIKRLTNAQFKKEAAKPNTVVIDVRTPDEYNEGHIEGAVLMDYLETEKFTKQVLTLDPEKNYILYCRSGKRSLNAANIMVSKGFKKVSDLKDGISEWDGPIVTTKK